MVLIHASRFLGDITRKGMCSGCTNTISFRCKPENCMWFAPETSPGESDWTQHGGLKYTSVHRAVLSEEKNQRVLHIDTFDELVSLFRRLRVPWIGDVSQLVFYVGHQLKLTQKLITYIGQLPRIPEDPHVYPRFRLPYGTGLSEENVKLANRFSNDLYELVMEKVSSDFPTTFPGTITDFEFKVFSKRLEERKVQLTKWYRRLFQNKFNTSIFYIDYERLRLEGYIGIHLSKATVQVTNAEYTAYGGWDVESYAFWEWPFEEEVMECVRRTD